MKGDWSTLKLFDFLEFKSNLFHKFINKLRKSGLRPTKQRIKICEVLFDAEQTFHFTIKELVKIIENQENKRRINGKSMKVDENPEGRRAGQVISPREQPKIIENQRKIGGESMENP